MIESEHRFSTRMKTCLLGGSVFSAVYSRTVAMTLWPFQKDGAILDRSEANDGGMEIRYYLVKND